jgi:hypothetical protein
MSPYFMTTFQINMHVHYSQESGHFNIMLKITNGESTDYLHTACDMFKKALT